MKIPPSYRLCRRPQTSHPWPALRSFPRTAISLRATPRPRIRSRHSWPTPWRPAADRPPSAGALVPWICDALLSNHSVKAYGRDFMDFVRHMQAQGVAPLEVNADHIKLYKRALLEAGRTSATVARRLSVLRGAYEQLAAKGLVSWETAQDIAAVKAPERPEERHALADPAAGDRPARGHPDR